MDLVITLDILLFLALLVVGMILFAREWFAPDVVALGLIFALILLGLLEPDEAFAGFGSSTVMMILGLLIMTEALIQTGLIEVVGRWLLRYVGDKPARIKGITLILPSIMSAFMSNTASTAFSLPIILGFIASQSSECL